MRALVTGATGFIGNQLVLELNRRGWEVVCVVRRPVKPRDGRIRCLQGDLVCPESLRFEDLGVPVDVLFHFAAQLPAQDVPASQYFTANAASTLELLELADKLDIRSVVYASSLALVGPPHHVPITEDTPPKPRHPYHLSKLCGEQCCEMARRVSGRHVSSLRISSPYGIGMPPNTVLARFAHQVLHSAEIKVFGNGSRAQNFVHVSDILTAAIQAIDTSKPGVYNIGGAETTTMLELANQLVRLVPSTRSNISLAGIPDPEEGIRWEVDTKRAATNLGYRPQVALEQGLMEYLGWLQSNTPAPCWWWS
jgi:UDP-glucose 4-epimerase